MIFLLLLVGTTFPTSGFPYLAHNCDLNHDFTCNNGQCIPRENYCDGIVQCKDKSDEENCEPCEEPDYFLCKNSKMCISRSFVCDGANDCIDDSDEVDCESFKPLHSNNSTCESGMWMCTDGLCIMNEWVCNGQMDCPDGSDEGLGCSSNIECSDFKCSNGHCIPINWVCDGMDDCMDNSDEKECEHHVDPTRCTLNNRKFLCSNNITCIDLDKVCDGTPNCPDKSDESATCKDPNKSCSKRHCSHSCAQLPTGPRCLCRSGYLENGENNCVDINECDQYGICDQKCTNKPGSYECSCIDGYILQHDNSTCKAHSGDGVLIFSTKSEIREYKLSTKIYYPIAQQLKQVVGVKTDGNHIYWTDIFSEHESITKTNADGSNKEVIVSSGLTLPEDLAVDFVTGNIYFTDADRQHIGVCTNDGKNCVVIVNKDIEKPRAIVLDIDKGDMYWTDWGNQPKIGYSLMDGLNDRAFLSHDIHWPNGLALDNPNERLYWTDARKKTLESIRLDGTDRRIILDSIVKHPFTIAVFENRLYWSEWSTNSIDSCDKFTGKNHETIIKEHDDIYGIDIFHPALKTRKINPCSNAYCSDICLLSGVNSYTCACSVDKVMGPDRATCKETGRKQQLVVSAKDMLLLIEHQTLGKHIVSVLPIKVRNVGALAYNSLSNTLYISEVGAGRISSYSFANDEKSTLDIDGIGEVTSMAYDPMGNNLYICDAKKHSLEVVNLNTMSKKLLLHETQGEIPQSIALVPEEGVLFVALQRKDLLSSHIERMFMDGTARTHSIETELSGPITLHFDSDLYHLIFADAETGKIEFTSVDGETRHLFRSLSTAPIGITSLNSDIFWVNEYSKKLYWTSKNSSVNLNQKITLDIPDSIAKLQITSVSPQKQYNSSCHNKNGMCSHLCLMSRKQAVCACPTGMTLASDNRSCEERLHCTSNEFLCAQSHLCIPKSFVCNGHIDCNSREDEQHCVETRTCSDEHFRCNDGECIMKSQVCDNHFDCTDKSDEYECRETNGTAKCPSGFFKCANNMCISEVSHCDGVINCDDSSDETDCDKNVCTNDQFRCKSGTCIPQSWECDQEYDCIDFSDEHENCDTAKCSSDMFFCDNGKCLDKLLMCDGSNDCGDNSDENNCKRTEPCGPDEFACSSNTSICLLNSAKCNGSFECPHREDEKDCSSCLIDEFECANKRCIPYQWMCDKRDDCGDMSDEKESVCETSTSEVVDAPCTHGYRCKNGKCISMDLLCDGKYDCYDGSDEGGLCSTACKRFSNPCQQKCQPSPTGIMCRCNEGYRLSGDGHACEDENECEENPSRCSQICINRIGGYSCDCYEGFMLRADESSCKALGPPLSMIFTADNQIRELDQKSNSLRVIYSEDMPKILGMEVSLSEKSLYFSVESSETIQKIDPSTKVRQYIDQVGQPTYMSIDWSTNNIYYYNSQPNAKSLSVCNFESMMCAKLIDIDVHRQVSALAVDSVNKVLFYSLTSWWIFNSPSFVLYKLNLDGTGSHQLVNSSSGFVTGLTYDFNGKKVYYLDQHQAKISSIKYDGTNNVVLFENITRSSGLKFFENHLYYLTNGGYVGKCKLYGVRTCDNFKLHSYSSGIFTISHRVLQPTIPNVCLNHTCSYLCIVGSGDAPFKCVCEDGTTVAEKQECSLKQRTATNDDRRIRIISSSTGSANKSSHKLMTALLISLVMILVGLALIYYARKGSMKKFTSSLMFFNATYNHPPDGLDKPMLQPGRHEYTNPIHFDAATQQIVETNR